MSQFEAYPDSPEMTNRNWNGQTDLMRCHPENRNRTKCALPIGSGIFLFLAGKAKKTANWTQVIGHCNVTSQHKLPVNRPVMRWTCVYLPEQQQQKNATRNRQ